MGKFSHMGQPCVRCFDGDAHLYPLGMVQGLDKQRSRQEEPCNGGLVACISDDLCYGHCPVGCARLLFGHRHVALQDGHCLEYHLRRALHQAIPDTEEEPRQVMVVGLSN